MEKKYVIGLDFGTDSVRAMLVDATNGEEIRTAIHPYSRWAKGLYCNADLSQFRQHPLDYLEGMEQSVRKALADCPPGVINNIAGISIDTTGSTPVAVDRNGTPLALLPEFAENPNAMFVLWKDHTAHKEAEEINVLASQWGTDFTRYSGGTYSPEWFWSKILHILRKDDEVAAHAWSWMEHCDWMPALLTGETDLKQIKRSRCAAGHKAMWHEDFGGLPSEAYLERLDPRLKGIRGRLFTGTFTCDVAAGTISKEWAGRLGLPETVKIGVGGIDAHFGAVGAAIEPYTLVKVMGTSTCDMLVAPLVNHQHQLVRGICGQVDGSILPGMLGMEAGQSAFGDLYKWFENLISYPLTELMADNLNAAEIEQIKSRILPRLNEQAADLPLTENDEIALDWINGRRTPDVDLTLTGAITGLRLASSAPRIFKALVEATAYGSKSIMERFIEEGIAVNKVIVLGGISKKSGYVLQTLANVLEVPIEVVRSEQACALGAAMFAATVGGVYPDIQTAQLHMSSGFDAAFIPQPERVDVYRKLYRKYKKIGADL
jgi:L-ribulokinase